MSVAPVTGGPLAGFATVSNPVKTSLLTRFRPIEAPRPSVEFPLWKALATVLLVLFEDPLIDTAPPVVMVIPLPPGETGMSPGLAGSTAAMVCSLSRFMANEPAMPKLPEASVAPEVAVAQIVLTPPFIPADRLRPVAAVSLAVMLIDARLVMFTRLTAAAAPTVPELPLLADPSAAALAWVTLVVV